MKALSIIRVFFVHAAIFCGLDLGQVGIYLFPFHVNLIFFVSGYLLFRKQLGSRIVTESSSYYIRHSGQTMFWNIVYRLLLPTLLFSLIIFFPKKLVRGQEIVFGDFAMETIGGGTFWFTSALTIAEFILLALLCLRIKKIWVYWWMSMALLALGSYLIDNNIPFLGIKDCPWAMSRGLCAISFLVTGGLFWKYESQIKRILTWHFVLAITVLYAIAMTFWGDSIASLMDVSYVMQYPIGCIAGFILLGICTHLPSIPLITFIGQYSIGFYFMSGALPTIICAFLSHTIGVGSWCSVMVAWGISLFVAYCTTYLLNRYTPWLFDLRRLREERE